MQQGMLYHSLSSAGSGVDLEQVVCTLREPLQEENFRQAWAQVARRHAVLGTCFAWVGHDELLQVVDPDPVLAWRREDWTQFSDEERAAKLERFLEEDRLRDFAMDRAPLMRHVLFKCGDNAYLCVWTFHHAILDGRSFPIVLREVFEYYRAYGTGDAPRVDTVVPYRTFLEWLGKRPEGACEEFWRKELAGFTAPTAVELGAAPSAGAVVRGHGAEQRRLPREVTARLEAAAASCAVTINTLIQAAWALLLSHYTRKEDIVFGTTRACRSGTVPGAESMVGLLINTIPLRIAVDREASTRSFLQRVRARHVALRDFEHSALGAIQSWSEIPRGLPLCGSLVVFEKQSLDASLRLPGAEWANRTFQYRGQTNFPLTLIGYGGQELLLSLEYDRNRFEAAAIDRMLGHLVQLLLEMAAHPDAPAHSLRYVTQEEEKALLARALLASDPVPAAGAIHERFAAQVARTPERVAVSCNGRSLTYRELDRRAHRLACHLSGLGVGPGVLVGLATDRDLELAVGILGILQAGGAYLPLDLRYPPDRLTFMLQDSQTRVLVTQRSLQERLPAAEAQIVCLEDLEALDVGPGARGPGSARRVGAEDVAYVIYTSGSTGRPKGVLVTHGNVLRLFDRTAHWFQFDETDVWTLFHSYAFDFSVWELWGALLHGGRVVVIPYETSRSPGEFYDLLARESVTVLNQTPSAFRQLIQAEEDKNPHSLALRYVILGGEALELQALGPWIERHGDARPQLVNMYGITETTVHVTYRRITRQDLDAGKGSMIGGPIPDLEVLILDPYLRPVPIGIVGEIFVGGSGVSLGYLQRPELTRERFLEHPFAPGRRIYRSGDLGRFTADGDIEYLGRADQQVQIRGFRVELGEIESVLGQHPGVRDAVVLAREDVPGEKRLVAYVVGSLPGEAVTGELRQHLKAVLPDYMVPAAFVVLEKLPLTHNGKIDRAALPPPPSRTCQRTEFVAPRTPLEEALASIWATVLRVERVGVHDNFFELGGDSILSMQVVYRARKQQLTLTPMDLFARPTIAELAGVARAETKGADRAQGPIEGTSCVTPIQHWFFEQELADAQHYNQAFLFTVYEPLDEAAARKALAAVQRHHDALRSRFRRASGVWSQTIGGPSDSDELPFEQYDLAAVPDEHLAAAIGEIAAARQASLDLENGPIWRAVYFRLGGERGQRFLWVVHHLAVDGVSWRILMEDLEDAYRQAERGADVDLGGKTTSFLRWAELLAQEAGNGKRAEEWSYWQGVLAGPHQPLPSQRGAGDDTEASTRTVSVSLTPEETHHLIHSLPQAYNTRINDALLTALAHAMSSCTGGREVTFNLEGHGREDLFEGVDLSRTVGWFTTIFPVRLRLPDSGTVRDELKAVKQQLQALPGRGFGYGVLRYLAGKSLEGAAEPEIIFNYLGRFDEVLGQSQLFGFAREGTGPWHSPRQRRRYKLEVNSMIIGRRLEVVWSYSESWHSRAAIERLAQEFLAALRHLIAQCLAADAGGYTPSDFPLCGLDQATLDGVVGTARDVEDVYPLGPMQLLFFARAAGDSRAVLDQWQCTLSGALDVQALQQAWQDVLEQHAVLRSSFHGEGLRAPVQVVHRHPRPPWRIESWHPLSAEEEQRRWERLLAEDQRQDLPLDRAPLMRFTLVHVAGERHRFLWTVPALLLDGWSWPLVFRDLSQAYEARCRQQRAALPASRSYRDYLEWLQQQDVSGAMSFWREYLAGLTEATPLPCRVESAPEAGEGFGRLSCLLPRESVDGLQQLARYRRTTLNVVLQTAWALVLSRLSRRQDVVFGAAVSGRPTALVGAESTVGPFVNNVPVRVRLQDGQALADVVDALHEHLLRLGPNQFVSLAQIQSWSQVPWHDRLFHSLVVLQNYGVDESSRRLGTAVRIEDFAGPIHSNVPLLLLIEPNTSWRISAIFDRRIVCETAAQRWLGDFVRVAERLGRDRSAEVERVRAELSEPAAATAPARRRFAMRSQNQVPPQTEMERAVARVWERVIQVERIGVEENVFDLGAHSLLMLQLHKEMEDALGRRISLVTLFQYPTIRLLAHHLACADQAGDPLADTQSRAQRQRGALAQLRFRSGGKARHE